jgi:hypothetical protein
VSVHGRSGPSRAETPPSTEEERGDSKQPATRAWRAGVSQGIQAKLPSHRFNHTQGPVYQVPSGQQCSRSIGACDRHHATRCGHAAQASIKASGEELVLKSMDMCPIRAAHNSSAKAAQASAGAQSAYRMPMAKNSLRTKPSIDKMQSVSNEHELRHLDAPEDDHERRPGPTWV